MRAELGQVLGHELRVQQAVSAGDQPRDKVHKRDLGRIAPVGKHALAEERGLQGNAVESADQLAVLPAFHTVRVADLVKAQIELFDGAVDPGLGAAWPGGGAGQDDVVERGVEPHLERFGPHRPGQPPRHVEALQGNHAPALGVDQEDAGVLAGVRHGEDAAGVTVQEVAGVERGHAPRLAPRRAPENG